MANIIIYFENSLFSAEEKKQLTKYFLKTKLGKIYQHIPWQKLIRFFSSRRKKGKGRNYRFPIQTEIAMLILQAIEGLSARELMEGLVYDVSYQLFCNIRLTPSEAERYHVLYDIIKRYKITEKDILFLQKELLEDWKDYLSDTLGLMMDATVFQSNISWPQDIKLLDQSLAIVYKYLKTYGQLYGYRVYTRRYQNLHKEYQNLIKQRRVVYKKHRNLLKRQVNLLSEWLKKLEVLLGRLEKAGIKLTEAQRREIETINQICQERQRSLSGEVVSHPTISLYKPYVHGIYRGKARVKREHGLKYHFFTRGSLAFIDHISEYNYNESKRFIETVEYSRFLFGSYPLYLSVDRIYGSNKNRVYAKSKGIKTNFVAKGRRRKDHHLLLQLHRELNIARNSQMEGLFGDLKSHYYTERVRYKSMESEILMVFFSLVAYNSKKVSEMAEAMARESVS